MIISSIIKYEGNNDVFVWKHPNEDFNTTTQLIVHETQEAILFRNGQALDLFGSGRHTLESENIPFLSRIINIPTGGKTPFHCEVYFINKVDSMNILWGTSNQIPIKDVVYDIILPIGANGQFAVRIGDSRKLILKLVGTVKEFNQSTLTMYFRGLLMTRIKDYISNQMIKNKLTFLDIHSHLNDMSLSIQEELSIVFEEYGIRLVNFFVNSIIVPENDPSYIRLRNALSKKTEMGIIGYNYHQERTFDVLEKAADNQGSGSNIMGAGIGLGMGVNIGGTVGQAMGNAMQNIDTKVSEGSTYCVKCHTLLVNNAKFCLECGQKVESADRIQCPNCKEITQKGKFCINCGNRIENNCPKCGTKPADGAKFCLECGEKL